MNLITSIVGESDIGQFRRVLLGTLHTYLWYIFSRQDFCHATEVSKLQSTAKTQNNHDMFCLGHSLLSKIIIS